MNLITNPTFDESINDLNDADALAVALDIIRVMCESSNLEDEYKTCLNDFQDIQWEALPDINIDAFIALHERGVNGELTREELDEFLDMVSIASNPPLYFFMRKGVQLTEDRLAA